jgi:hypothetical protein
MRVNKWKYANLWVLPYSLVLRNPIKKYEIYDGDGNLLELPYSLVLRNPDFKGANITYYGCLLPYSLVLRNLVNEKNINYDMLETSILTSTSEPDELNDIINTLRSNFKILPYSLVLRNQIIRGYLSKMWSIRYILPYSLVLRNPDMFSPEIKVKFEINTSILTSTSEPCLWLSENRAEAENLGFHTH